MDEQRRHERAGSTGWSQRRSAGREGRQFVSSVRQNGDGTEKGDYLERGHHFAFFLTVENAIVVLHRDERRQVVIDRVVCKSIC